eukprot:scaffold1187_cov258-Pinguiococcus_pyrenoidosus.AAC.2
MVAMQGTFVGKSARQSQPTSSLADPISKVSLVHRTVRHFVPPAPVVVSVSPLTRVRAAVGVLRHAVSRPSIRLPPAFVDGVVDVLIPADAVDPSVDPLAVVVEIDLLAWVRPIT